jgi:hypothetical protein
MLVMGSKLAFSNAIPGDFSAPHKATRRIARAWNWMS